MKLSKALLSTLVVGVAVSASLTSCKKQVNLLKEECENHKGSPCTEQELENMELFSESCHACGMG